MNHNPEPTFPFDAAIDATGLKCPLPVLRAKKSLHELAIGQVLRVAATDPAAPRDFLGLADHTAHVLVHSSEVDGVYYFWLRKGG